MAKWADYLIFTVRYNEKHSHIIKVKTYTDSGNGLKDPYIENRDTVISKLKKGNEYCTIRKRNGDWAKGEKVHKIVIKGKEYIRTDKNETEKDNLGNLPEF